MVLVGAMILPHGALIIDPTKPELAADNATRTTDPSSSSSSPLAVAAESLHNACIEAAATALETHKNENIDLVIVYTPHGIQSNTAHNDDATGTVSVYNGNPKASGSCEWMGDWSQYQVNVSIDVDAANQIINKINEHYNTTTTNYNNENKDSTSSSTTIAHGVSAFSQHPVPLRWGETVPLFFTRNFTEMRKDTNQSHSDSTNDYTKQVSVCIISHGPSTTAARCATAAIRMDETRTIGEAISEWSMLETHKRVLLLISADLAHVHGNARCPLKKKTKTGKCDDNGMHTTTSTTHSLDELDHRYSNANYSDMIPHPSAAAFEQCLIEWLALLKRGQLALAREMLCSNALELLPDAK